MIKGGNNDNRYKEIIMIDLIKRLMIDIKR